MDDLEPRQPVTIARDELYRRVWESPMSRLAAEFGISGNGLAKICDRLKIPYPPRGYWARKEAGQEVVRFRLLKPDSDTPGEVTITPTPTPPKLAPEVQEANAAAHSKAEGIVVPDELKRPHAIISGWLAEHKERKRRDRIDRNPYRPAMPDWTDGEHRQHRILDAIFRAVEKNGLMVRSEDLSTFYFEYKTEKIHCRLREKNKQVRRPKTAEEMRWSSGQNWTQVLEPTGNLIFSFEDYFGHESRLRREWLETTTKRFEAMVPDIVATLLLAGPALVKLREDREEEKRRREEAERLRQIEQARRKKDRNQWRSLVEQAERHETATKVRNLLAALERTASDPSVMIGDRSLADWIAWAKAYLEAVDPVCRGVEGIFGEISKVTDWTYRD
ncbi:hypothetical protein [Hyphomicrobium sp.]|uniref:hypothetical protein n=1 Tax=Hyphomicrobium sp. TaxID=82 RepID=UPI003F7278E2